MILLDSDHLTVLRYRTSPRAIHLTGRLALAFGSGIRIGTTVASVEEQMRGWLATLARERQVRRQIGAYRELAELFTFFSGYHIALFDDLSAERFDQLKAAKVRIGTSDLKIAAIALVNDALLLTANKRDFEQVPGLRFENWMD
jgi:tRNA(fMet)-specific endonuclease VapC